MVSTTTKRAHIIQDGTQLDRLLPRNEPVMAFDEEDLRTSRVANRLNEEALSKETKQRSQASTVRYLRSGRCRRDVLRRYECVASHACPFEVHSKVLPLSSTAVSRSVPATLTLPPLPGP